MKKAPLGNFFDNPVLILLVIDKTRFSFIKMLVRRKRGGKKVRKILPEKSSIFFGKRYGIELFISRIALTFYGQVVNFYQSRLDVSVNKFFPRRS